MSNNRNEITHILFDLGGVIIELRGPAIKEEWIGPPMSVDEIWERWLLSPAAKEFESGLISPDEFAKRIVDELSLDVTPEVLLEHIKNLMLGLYEGAPELLRALRPRYTTGLYSNSNELHWQIKMEVFGLKDLFDYFFPSHLIGKVKPDPASLEYVLAEMQVPAERILFLDDNRLNVEKAREYGIAAERVKGIDEAMSCLRRHGISW